MPEARIYIASKTNHGPRWRHLRDEHGAPFISTWINEAEAGATIDWPDLWSRCIREAATADALVLYREGGEVLKGAWAEVGAALAHGKPIFAVGCDEFNIRHHRLFHRCVDLGEAISRASMEPRHAD